MIKLRFILVGKVKDSYLKTGYEEYIKRLSKYGKVTLEYVDEEKLNDSPSKLEILKALDEEGKKVLNRIKDDEYVITCDIHGKNIDSMEFSSFLEKNIDLGKSTFTFVIGSSYGLSDLIRKRSNFLLSFSKMTFTHPLTLLLILEQVYRAFKIMNNENYQK